MKRREGKQKSQVVRLRVWSRTEALAALPYIATIMRSLREHRLEANRHRRTARLFDERPGKLGRDTLIAREEANREADRAEQQFEAALHELQGLDVYCLDAVGGQALIPFVNDDQLAWFVYDLFEADHLRYWRYQSDPLETRRPIAEASEGRDQASIAV